MEVGDGGGRGVWTGREESSRAWERGGKERYVWKSSETVCVSGIWGRRGVRRVSLKEEMRKWLAATVVYRRRRRRTDG